MHKTPIPIGARKAPVRCFEAAPTSLCCHRRGWWAKRKRCTFSAVCVSLVREVDVVDGRNRVALGGALRDLGRRPVTIRILRFSRLTNVAVQVVVKRVSNFVRPRIDDVEGARATWIEEGRTQDEDFVRERSDALGHDGSLWVAHVHVQNARRACERHLLWKGCARAVQTRQTEVGRSQLRGQSRDGRGECEIARRGRKAHLDGADFLARTKHVQVQLRVLHDGCHCGCGGPLDRWVDAWIVGRDCCRQGRKVDGDLVHVGLGAEGDGEGQARRVGVAGSGEVANCYGVHAAQLRREFMLRCHAFHDTVHKCDLNSLPRQTRLRREYAVRAQESVHFHRLSLDAGHKCSVRRSGRRLQRAPRCWPRLLSCPHFGHKDGVCEPEGTVTVKVSEETRVVFPRLLARPHLGSKDRICQTECAVTIEVGVAYGGWWW